MSLPKTQKAILIEENGDLDVLKYVDYDTPQPSADDIIIKNKFSGVNFIEGYFRTGVYPAPLPYILGREATGVVVEVGKNVTNYKPGDKVAYLGSPNFCQYTKLSSSHVAVLKLPENTSDEKSKLYAGSLLQGLTALTFINEAYEVKKGDYILVWAAAGGVGRILTQLISGLGAHVIALASSAAKLEIAKSDGAEFLINSTTDDVVAKVKEITNNKGVQASFDGVGKDSFEASFELLTRKGTLVSFGNASGVVPPFSITRLSAKNIKIARPQLFGYVTTPEEWKHYSTELYKLIDSGKLKIDISKTYPLSDYKQAAADLEGRKTTGKLVLEIPQ